jgi:hypothetical protein
MFRKGAASPHRAAQSHRFARKRQYNHPQTTAMTDGTRRKPYFHCSLGMNSKFMP